MGGIYFANLTLGVKRGLSSLVLGNLMQGVLSARLSLAEGLLDLGDVHLCFKNGSNGRGQRREWLETVGMDALMS